MDTKHKVYNLIILDESGSMAAIKSTIISGFNEVVQTVKGVPLRYPEQEHIISLVTFNDLGIKTLLDNEDVNKLGLLNEARYQPDAMTPLYDAMGLSISRLRKVTDLVEDCHVLVTILTDGEENSSVEFTGESIKKIVDELKLKNWTFTYIGANHDVEKFALSISITNIMKFEANDQDIKRMFEDEQDSRLPYSEKIRQGQSTSEGYYSDEKSD